jgi:hypothetical protein
MSCGINTEDAFQIAYLTMRGWDFYDVWTKPGFTRTVKEWAGGSHYKDVETDRFDDTAEAYRRQKESEGGDG